MTYSPYWSFSPVPDDINWPKPHIFFHTPTHFFKVWSFDPNHVPHYLIPSHCQEAGFYPIRDKKQIKQRDDFMKDHNKCPQWLAQSVFPNKYYVCFADDGPLDVILSKKLKNKIANDKNAKATKDADTDVNPMGVPDVKPGDLDMEKSVHENSNSVKEGKGELTAGDNDMPKLKDVDVATWLVEDFMKMFNDATLLSLHWPKAKNPHVQYDDKNAPKFPRRDIMKGKQICLYCKKCWERDIETPVCFVKINSQDKDDSVATKPSPATLKKAPPLPIQKEPVPQAIHSSLTSDIQPKAHQLFYPHPPPTHTPQKKNMVPPRLHFPNTMREKFLFLWSHKILLLREDGPTSSCQGPGSTLTLA
jgi:hypothetical protein